MGTKRGLDEDILTFVDNSDLPPERMRLSKWERIFSKIPAGKSLVIREGQISLTAVRSSLYDLKRKGKFKHLRARKIKQLDGSYIMYVINTSK